MAENIIITADYKDLKYEQLLPQIDSVVEQETDLIANLANISAMLKEVFKFFWVGFYIVKNNQLVLGPFQGPLACTRIKKGKGVCGKCWEKAEAVLVEDVDKFPGHIACSSLSKSEVVVPVFVDGTVIAVIDVDSDEISAFDNVDVEQLEKIAVIVSKLFKRCKS